jgi:hypothetical protein
MIIPNEILTRIIEYIPRKYEDEINLKLVNKNFYKILNMNNILNTNWIIDREEHSKIVKK